MVSELHFLNPLKLAKMSVANSHCKVILSLAAALSSVGCDQWPDSSSQALASLLATHLPPLALFRERHGRKLARFLSNSTFHCNLPAFELCRMKCHLESDLHFPIVHKVAAMQIEINSGQVSIENQVTPTQSLSLSSGKQYFLGRILLLCMCSVCVWCSSYIN